ERAADAGDDHRDHERRSGELRRGRAGDHEDPGADDRADAERRETEWAERSAERAGVRFGDEIVDRFASEKAHGGRMTAGPRFRVWRPSSACQRVVRTTRAVV